MEISIKIGKLGTTSIDTAVFWMFEDAKSPTPSVNEVDKLMDGMISTVLGYKDFKGHFGDTSIIYGCPGKKIKRVVLLGLGKQKEFNIEKIRRVTGECIRKIERLGIKKVTVPMDDIFDGNFNAYAVTKMMTESSVLGLYRFNKLFSEKPKGSRLSKLEFLVKDTKRKKILTPAINEAKIISKWTCFTRDLGNLPPNYLNIREFEKEAKKAAIKISNVKCKVYNSAELKKMGMNGILSVGRGSNIPPSLVQITYTPKQKPKKNVVFVGKGITFDSGGLSLKPSKGMYRMKDDMSGAGAAMSIVCTAAELKLPLNVTTLLPLAENMPDGKALRPGEVITMYNGKTVEVKDPDAEGRLVLADALSFSGKFKPDYLIDLATLTGAVTVALGRFVIGGMGNSDELMALLKRAGQICQERIWELPLWDEYIKQVNNDISDYKNYSGPEASSIVAGAFLSGFIPKNTNWVHMDIAAMAFSDEDREYIRKGSTGVGVRLCTQFLQNISNGLKQKV